MLCPLFPAHKCRCQKDILLTSFIAQERLHHSRSFSKWFRARISLESVFDLTCRAARREYLRAISCDVVPHRFAYAKRIFTTLSSVLLAHTSSQSPSFRRGVKRRATHAQRNMSASVDPARKRRRLKSSCLRGTRRERTSQMWDPAEKWGAAQLLSRSREST